MCQWHEDLATRSEFQTVGPTTEKENEMITTNRTQTLAVGNVCNSDLLGLIQREETGQRAQLQSSIFAVDKSAVNGQCTSWLMYSLLSQLRFDYDKTTIRRIRRYHDAFDYDGSDRNYDSTAIRLPSD